MKSIATLPMFDNNTAAAGLVEAFDADQNIVGHGAMISRAMHDVSWRLGSMVSRNVAGTLYCAKGDTQFASFTGSRTHHQSFELRLIRGCGNGVRHIDSGGRELEMIE